MTDRRGNAAESSPGLKHAALSGGRQQNGEIGCMAIQSNAGGAMTGREPERDEFKSKLAMTAARQPLNIRPTGKGRQQETARYFETVLRLSPQLAPAKQCSIKILMFRQKLV